MALAIFPRISLSAFYRPLPASSYSIRAPRARMQENEIPYDVFFLRGAKSALRGALAEDAGSLSEDAVATISALAVANPSMPDPAVDRELWTGSYDLLTASSILTIDGFGKVTLHDIILEDGAFKLEASIASDALVSMQGWVRADGDVHFQLELLDVAVPFASEQPTATQQALVDACDQAMGLQLTRDDDDATTPTCLRASPPLPSLRLRILYLDQSMLILARAPEADGEDGGAEEEEESRDDGDDRVSVGADDIHVLFKKGARS